MGVETHLPLLNQESGEAKNLAAPFFCVRNPYEACFGQPRWWRDIRTELLPQVPSSGNDPC
jgi:hypothetical protein